MRFRTPLNAVFGLLDMLIEQGLTPKQLEQTAQAKHAAHSLLLMLNRMLDFARVESVAAQLKLAPFSIVELVDICESLTAPLCENKGIELIIDIDPLIAPNLICDSIRLQQVLGNLLTNAVKFTKTGSITLKMDLLPSDTSEQQHICFKVIDTGVGIDKADQRRLFDAFTQGDESSTRTHHGVGLGLAIVKSAVLLMGGEIALNSEKGEGCEFYFSVLLDVVPACKQLPDNTLVILSAHSHELTQVINAFPTLTYTNLEQILKSPREHLKAKQLIIGAADLPALLAVAVIKDILFAKAITLIVVSNQPRLNLPISMGLTVQHIKTSALAQRLFNLNLESALKITNTTKLNPSVSGLLVLAIDDNQLNLEIISSVLRQAKINVVTATSAIDGMALLPNLMPDLILMDVQMPHLDGCQATTLIRQQYSAEQLPIFALTAHCEPADIERSLACGMNKHLTKPVVAEVLIGAITDLAPYKPSFFEYSFALTQFSLNETLLNTMIGKFASVCKNQLAQLKISNNKDDLIRIAHSIKGVAGNLGFSRLSQCAQQTEKDLKTTDKAVEITTKELIMQLEQVVVFINVLGAMDVKKS